MNFTRLEAYLRCSLATRTQACIVISPVSSSIRLHCLVFLTSLGGRFSRARSRDDLLKWHRERIVRNGLMIVIVGDLDESAMAKMVDTLFADLPEKGWLPEIPDINVKDMPEKVIHLPVGPTAQASVIMGGLTMTADDPKRWIAASMLNMILVTGRNSRLFRAVREETGKTYGLVSRLQSYSKTGALTISGRIDKDGVDETVALIRRTIAEFRKNGPTTAEERNAKAAYSAELAKTLTDHAQLANMLLTYAGFGWSIDTIRQSAEIAQSVDLSDPAYREALLPEMPTIVVGE